MQTHAVQVFAGFVSSTIFITSNFPMLLKAFKTKDMHSYSMGQLILGNLGNTVYWLYVASLPVGPVWYLQGFFSAASATMLFCYLRYEKHWFRRPKSKASGGPEIVRASLGRQESRPAFPQAQQPAIPRELK